MGVKTRVLLIAAGVLASPGLAPGQEVRASLAGTITDPTGAVVAGAAARLVNMQTTVSFAATSNDAGQYRFLFLNPGRYKLVVEMAGFKTFERENIELQVNQAATLDVVLEVGSQTERITVAAEAPLLEAEKPDRGLVVDNRRVVDIPINTRNPLMLAALSNGITHTSGSTLDLRPFSNSAMGSWSVNGGQAYTAEFLLDGVPNNAIYNNASTVAFVPAVDAVQEFKVMTSTYDAQYGHSGGGTINISLKSGTNQWHGSGYEFLKRTFLNANTFSNNARGSPREGNALDQYGFSVGGPVSLPRLYQGRDRTFFFVAWEGYRENTEYPAEKIASVPTLEQRRGDFSKTFDNAGRLMPIYDPLTGRQEGNRWVRDPFPGNMIPASRINPVGAKLAALYPEPNTVTQGSVAWQSNFFWPDNTARFKFWSTTARLDHTFGPKERVYARWSYNDFDQVRITNALKGLGANWRNGGKTANSGVLDSVTLLTPTTILNFRAGISYWVERLGPPDVGFDGTQIGWPAALVNQLPNKATFPTIGLGDYTAMGTSYSNVTLEPTTILSLQPNIALIRGKHTIKAGLDFRLTRYTQYRPQAAGGELNFNRAFTRADYLTQDALSGNSAASLLLGYAASGVVDKLVNPFYQWLYYAPWVQDDFKISRRLTLNLGLRLDMTTPVTERYNQANRGFFATALNPISRRIDQTRFPGFQVYGGIGFVNVNGLPRSPFDRDFNNLQPRIGAAFQLTNRTVLRGGWGLFYPTPTSTGRTLGYSQSTPFVATIDSGRTPADTISNPFPSGILPPVGSSLGLETFLGQSLSFVHPASRNPYVHQFSFGIQRQITGHISAEASYVGSRTRKALVGKGINDLSVEQLALGDPTKGGDPNYLNQQVPNPFAGLLPGTSLNSATVPRSQLLRPFPQFTGITMAERNDGQVWYNSLQVSAEVRNYRGLTLTANYTLSKNIEALSYLNSQDPAPGRTLTAWDRPHRLAFAPIWDLPFGPGRRFLSSQHGVVSRLVGGWEMVLNTVFQTGAPMSMPSNVWVLGDPRLEKPTWDRLFKTGVIDVNGTVRNVLPGEQPVFAVRPPNTLRTTPLRWGNLRNQWETTYDYSLIKNTRIREGMNLQFRVEAFNLFNTPVFSSNPNLTPTDPNFGKILRNNGQNNFPRTVQLGIRFSY